MMKKLTIIVFVFALCTAAFTQSTSKTLVAYFSFPITGGKEAFLKMQQLREYQSPWLCSVRKWFIISAKADCESILEDCCIRAH